MKLSKKANNIILRVMSMTDDEIASYLSSVDCPPHTNNLYNWWTWKGMKIPTRKAFALSILGYDCNQSYITASAHWYELDVDYQEDAYDNVLEEFNTRGVVMEIW